MRYGFIVASDFHLSKYRHVSISSDNSYYIASGIECIYNFINCSNAILFIRCPKVYNVAKEIKKTHGYRLPLLIPTNNKLLVPYFFVVEIFEQSKEY